ncbi:MAG: Do family serine endopeptidase [Geminicoccaceae bacterium]
MRRAYRPLALLVLLAACGVVGPPATGEINRQVPASQQDILLSFAPVVDKVAPAVVNIAASSVTREQAADPFFSDPLFQHFFRRFNRRPPERRRQQNALGSGVIVDPGGLIVTNNHVIENADEITIVLADRREYRAELLVADERADIALLQIQESGMTLPWVALGDSDQVAVGDLVLALGNPFGIGQSVTAGILSATTRSAPMIESDISFLQTDAAINPGNSGGALATLDGRIIGINTAIFTRGGGGSIGIGFAIPANFVTAFIARYEAGGGVVSRPWTGLKTQSVDAAVAESLGLERPVGVVVQAIYPGAAADRAGIQPGDVVVALDGREITDPQSLNYRIAVRAIGDEVAVDLVRRGEPLTARLEVDVAPAEPEPDPSSVVDGPLAGLRIANLSPAFADEIGVDPFARGVIVVGVERLSPASAARLRRGDLILAINRQAIKRVDDVGPALAGADRNLRLVIEREGRRLRLALSL